MNYTINEIPDEAVELSGNEMIPIWQGETKKMQVSTLSEMYALKATLDAQNTYSTEETFTGKYWIDGKKIYRKCFKSTGITSIPNALTNPNDIVLFTGVVKSNNVIQPIMLSGVDANFNYYGCVVMYQNNTIVFNAQMTGVNYVLLTVEYTKTTD